MAVPTITPNFTLLSDCDSTTGWTNDSFVLDPDVKKQGANSVSCILNSTGVNSIWYASAAQNLSNTHIRIWFNFGTVGMLDLQVNGGIRILVGDGANTGYWYVGGIDTYGGGWVLLTAYTGTTFDSGTCNLSAVTQIGVAVNLTGRPKNVINIWVDYLAYGDGYNVTGGTAVDPITLRSISEADNAAGYGVVQRINGVYFISSAVTIGGASDTYFEDASQIVVFEDQKVSSTLYKLELLGSAGSTTSFALTDSVIKSANVVTRFNLILNNADFDQLLFSGNTVVNANQTLFKAGQAANASIWNNCNQVVPLGANLSGNSFTNSVDPNGAILWPGGTSVQNCSFTNNANAIQMTGAGSFDFIGIDLEGNTIDINNTSGGSITINVSGGGTATGITFTGAVSVQSAATLTLTGIIDGSEVRILAHGTTNELYGLEEKLPGVNPSYSYTSAQAVDIVVHNLQYQYWRLNNYQLASSDATLPVAQVYDRNYNNP